MSWREAIRNWRRPLDVLGLVLGASYAAPAWLYPHGNDQALHWYVGQGLLLGELPYQSAISGKPVGIFVTHALASAAFGPSQWAIRVMETLCLLPLAYYLAGLARPSGQALRDGEWGAAFLLLCGVHYTFFDYWDISHPELWVALLTVWSAHLAVHCPAGVTRVLGCGALGAAAFMFKYTAAAAALPVAGYCGFRAIRETRTPGLGPATLSLMQAAGLYILGAAPVVTACLLPFVVFDAFAPMWEVLYTFMVRYVKQAPGVSTTYPWTDMDAGGPALIAGAAGIVLGLLNHLRARRFAAVERGLVLLLVGSGALGGVLLQKRFFSYHFSVLSPFIAGMILYGVLSVRPRSSGLLPFAAALGLTVSACLSEPGACTNPDYSYKKHIDNAYRYVTGRRARRAYLEPFSGINYLDRYWIHEHVALAAKARAQPGDQLCARGFAAAIYQVSGMRCPSRHVIQAWPAGLPSWEPEYQATIREARPRFIVTFHDRPEEVRALRRLGYHSSRMPSLYLLMDRGPQKAPRNPLP